VEHDPVPGPGRLDQFVDVGEGVPAVDDYRLVQLGGQHELSSEGLPLGPDRSQSPVVVETGLTYRGRRRRQPGDGVGLLEPALGVVGMEPGRPLQSTGMPPGQVSGRLRRGGIDPGNDHPLDFAGTRE
jgi:hypothetical protein